MDTSMENVNSPLTRYQKCMVLLIGLTSVLSAMPIYSTIFTVASPNFECTVDNTTVSDPCEFIKQQQNNATANLTCKFDQTYYGETIITEWMLICEKKFYASLTQTMYLIGTFSGLFTGYFGDRFGRKRAGLIMLAILSATLSLCQLLQFDFIGFSNQTQYVIYCVAQFIIGASTNSLFAITFILLIELVSHKHATLVSNANLYMFVLGELIIMGVAFFVRNWHFINWFMCAYSLITFILCAVYLPESPKYLSQRQRLDNDKLYVEMKKIDQPNAAEDNLANDNLLAEETPEPRESTDNSIIAYIFKSKDHLLRTLFLSYIWLSLTLVYYGVSLGITTVGDVNPYLMYTLSAVSEFIGYLLGHLNDKFGRKRMFTIFLGSASVMCLAVSLVQLMSDSSTRSDDLNVKTVLIIVCTSVGKAMASASFSSAYIFTSQMFATRVRNTLILFVSSVGRIGSIISPQINLLGVLVWKQLPYLIFSVISSVGCIFILLLPNPANMNHL